jgi:hypothetical protein
LQRWWRTGRRPSLPLRIGGLVRSAVYTELVQEFGPRIRNFPQSPQLFWSEFKKCLTCKDGESLLIECFHGRRVSRGGVRDRWVQLPSLEDSRAWWCRHKFENSWGQDPSHVPGSMIPGKEGDFTPADTTCQKANLFSKVS